MSQSLDESPAAAAPRFTQTQGQYLAFIYAYSRIFKRPPAEADMRRHFEVTAPTVHQMVLMTVFSMLASADFTSGTADIGSSLISIPSPRNVGVRLPSFQALAAW